MSTVSFAGVSRVNGELKFRGANDANRINQLRKLGDTDVELRFLEREMTKQEAAQKLLDMDFAQGRADVQALLTAVASKTSAPKQSRTVKVKGAKIARSEPKLSIEEANKLVLATMRELTPAEALELKVTRAVKPRRSRKVKELV